MVGCVRRGDSLAAGSSNLSSAKGNRSTKVAPRPRPSLITSTVCQNDVLHDREADAESRGRPGDWRVLVTEPLEQMGQELRADALTLVRHRQHRPRTVHDDADPDHILGLAEFDRVGEQVPGDLLQPDRITGDRNRRRGGGPAWSWRFVEPRRAVDVR